VPGCQTLQYREPSLRLLQTDSAELTLRGFTRIGFAFANTAGKPISSQSCYPILEKKINDEWKTLPFSTLLDCFGTTLESGVIFHNEVGVFAANIADLLGRSKSIDGTYRLRWQFV